MVLRLAESIPDTYEGPVAVEYRRRLKMPKDLKKSGKSNEFSPILLRDKEVHGGMRGMGVDKTVMRSVSPDGCGITVGLLHTDDTFPDSLAADGLIYHYPNAARPSGCDLYGINSTKNAGLLGLPVFVVTITGPGRSPLQCADSVGGTLERLHRGLSHHVRQDREAHGMHFPRSRKAIYTWCANGQGGIRNKETRGIGD